MQPLLDGGVHVLAALKGSQVGCKAIVALIVATRPSKLFSKEFVDCCSRHRVFRTYDLTCVHMKQNKSKHLV
jgi:hypothetical protein